MKKIIVTVLVLFVTIGLFAGNITVTDGVYKDNILTEEVNRQLDEIAVDLNAKPMIDLTGNQTEFARANGNASSASIINGSLYSGLDAGIASVSFSAGSVFENPSKISGLVGDVQDGEDTYVGASISGFATNVIVNGDNLVFLPLKGLMLEAKFGYYSNDDLVGTGVQYDSLLIGAGARYKVAALPVQAPMFNLRALTVGSGIYFTSSKMAFEPDPIEQNSTGTIAATNETVKTETETQLKFNVSNNSVVIPVELVTSAKALMFFNLIAGTGFDLVMGQTTIDVDSDSDIIVYKDEQVQDPITNPQINLEDSETKESPSILRYKMIFGLGLNLGPARLEVPVAYYPASGFAISVVSGASF